MKKFRPFAMALHCALMLTALVSPAFAQFSKLGDLADQFSGTLKRANAKVVVVDEFTTSGAGWSPQGEYFSSFVASILKSHNQKMTVATLQKKNRWLPEVPILNPGLLRMQKANESNTSFPTI